MACPSCGASLQAWSHARARRIRQLSGPDLLIRPRRARCRHCSRTHVLLPSTCQPRRADATEVIANALHASVFGHGRRRIAATLGRPESTVRRWLRAGRPAHATRLYHQAARLLIELRADIFNALAHDRDTVNASPLRQALTMIGACIAAITARTPSTGHHRPALIGAITDGRLIPPATPG
nr:DUF6431 domain-containing protein [Kineosporia babensis]